MVQNVIKEQIAIILFTGVILTLFVFMGTFAGNFLSEITKKSSLLVKILILGIFFIISILAVIISIIILLNQTDLHIFGDLFRK